MMILRVIFLPREHDRNRVRDVIYDTVALHSSLHLDTGSCTASFKRPLSAVVHMCRCPCVWTK